MTKTLTAPQISKILQSLSLVAKTKEYQDCCKSDDTLDVKKFSTLPKVKEIVALLKAGNVNAEVLRKKGFISALLLLGQSLK